MANFIIDDLKAIVKGDNPMNKLILINVVIFLVYSVSGKTIDVNHWFDVPGKFSEFIVQPWTILTYTFLHASFMHVLFNMLFLYWFGRILLNFVDSRKFLSIYFLGGIAGGLTYIVAFNVLSSGGSSLLASGMVGASACVMAVTIAAATLTPDYQIRLILLGNLPLKYVALAVLILTSLQDLSFNTGGKLAHLGGAAIGYIFIRQLQQGNDLSRVVFGITDGIKNLFAKKKPKMRVVKRQAKSGNRPVQNNTRAKEDQQRIDAILDKISASGYDALTAEEKEILFRASNKK